MTDKAFDFKKEYKDLYAPKGAPALIDVPQMTFIAVDGKGDPNNNFSYQEAIGILYALSYAIKMSKMSGRQPSGYFDYVVPPLEGLWWIDGGVFEYDKRDNWLWTSLIRQPDFVTQKIFDWAAGEAKKKKPELNFSRARLEKFTEGLCVQAMHAGSYAAEPGTVEKMRAFMSDNGLRDDIETTGRKHHEIYLSDPRRAAPEKLKTVLRHPVSRRND